MPKSFAELVTEPLHATSTSLMCSHSKIAKDTRPPDSVVVEAPVAIVLPSSIALTARSWAALAGLQLTHVAPQRVASRTRAALADSVMIIQRQVASSRSWRSQGTHLTPST